jgi:hypothetical protein
MLVFSRGAGPGFHLSGGNGGPRPPPRGKNLWKGILEHLNTILSELFYGLEPIFAKKKIAEPGGGSSPLLPPLMGAHDQVLS